MTIFIKLIIDRSMKWASITQTKNETIEILHLNRKSLWNIFFGLKCDWQPWLNDCEWKLALKSTRYQNRSKIKGFLPDSLAGISFIFLPFIKKTLIFSALWRVSRVHNSSRSCKCRRAFEFSMKMEFSTWELACSMTLLSKLKQFSVIIFS